MSEWDFVFFVGIKFLILGFFMICYVIGGREGSRKFVRRWIGGIGFGLMIIGLSVWMGKFNWLLLPLPAAYSGALCLGYGSEVLWQKIARRFVYGLAFGLIGLYAGLVLHNLYLGIVQLILPVLVSTFLGVMNPVRATDEEAMLSLALVIHVPFML